MKKSVPTIPYRRKRDQKTNYRKRLGLLKSGKDRLVIRKSNKYITIQVVSFIPKGDKIIKSCTSQELVKLGWKFSCKNIPAAYLTGLLIASKMKSEKNKECIIDFGLHSPLKGYNKFYAVLKGAFEGKLSFPVDTKVLPTDDQVLGKTEAMQKAVADLKKKILN